MTGVINFKEQTILTIQERSNLPFHSGCKMFTWTCNENPIKVTIYFERFLIKLHLEFFID